jgi:hypothetical protein
VGVTVDQGLLGTSVDVCSGSRVDDSVWDVGTTDDPESEVELGTEFSIVVSADVVIVASDDMVSACHVQIHPVFVGSTEQIISDVHVRIVFHLSSKHPKTPSQRLFKFMREAHTLKLKTLTSPCPIRAILPLIERVVREIGVDNLGKACMSQVVTSSRKMLRRQSSGERKHSQKEDGRGEEWAHCE